MNTNLNVVKGDKRTNVIIADGESDNFLYGLEGKDVIFDYNYMVEYDPDYEGPSVSILAASDSFIFGGKGNDYIISRGGSDILSGGKGNDEFKVIYDLIELEFSGDTLTKVHGGKGYDCLELEGFSENALITVDEETGDTLVQEGHKSVLISHTVEHFEFV